MKIERRHLEQALLIASLRQFEDVPPEAEIHHNFSEHFQKRIAKISKKSENAAWRYWRSPLKRAVIIAILVVLLLGMIACTPVVQNALIAFFLEDSGEAYGITFDPEAAATAPRSIEQYRVPQYEPEGYVLVYREGSEVSVDFLWINESGGTMGYSQSFIPQNAANSSWIGIDSTDMERSTENLNGYKVELIYNSEQYIAVWTDNLYIYTIDFVSYSVDPLETVTNMMASIVDVPSVEPLG